MTYADGIYFGMGEDEYLAINRLSPSGLKQLRISAATFWADSWLNPNPRELTEEQQTRQELAKVLGRAYHVARLEPETFHVRYCRALDKLDYEGQPGFIAGGTAYGKALGELGEAKSKAGEGVFQQAQRLSAAGYEGPIWDLELASWEATKGERIALKAIFWDEIMQDMARIEAMPEIHALVEGGQPEVAILWTCPGTGLPMKTKLDYLRPDGWMDFKTFANSNGKHVQTVITESFMFNRYHIQAAVQREAVDFIRTGQLQIIGDASDEARAMVAAIQIAPAELDCHFVWQEKGGIPNIWARKLRFFDVPLNAIIGHAGASEEAQARVEEGQRQPTAWFRKALAEVRVAKRTFADYCAIYEPGEPWLPPVPMGELSDIDFRQYWLEEPAE